MKQASVSMEYIQETLEFGNKEILRSWEEGWLESRFRFCCGGEGLMKQAIVGED